jgi:quercetin dioxygenase-like cupin family protein
MKNSIVAGLVLSISAGAALAASGAPDLSQMNPAVMKGMLPDQIPWQVTPGLDTAYLYGNPAQPGFYVLMYRWKPGNSSHPHYHSQDRYIMVLSGTWWVGQGTNWDPEHVTAPVKPGTYVTHYARQVHYDGARTGDNEPAVELVWGMGPVATVVCDGPNAEKAPGPCEDARKAAGK